MSSNDRDPVNSPVMPITYEPYYTPAEAAKIVKCSPATMRRFFDEHPDCIVLNPGSRKPRRRLPRRALDQLLRRLKING